MINQLPAASHDLTTLGIAHAAGLAMRPEQIKKTAHSLVIGPQSQEGGFPDYRQSS